MKKLRRRIRASFATRSWRAGAYSVFAAVLVIAIAAVAVLAVSALPEAATQWDLSPNQIYSISEGTEHVLASLDRDVQIYWLAQEDNENNTMRQVLSRYAQYERVTVTQVDPVRYPGFAAAYTDETVDDNSVVVVCGERSMFIPYVDMWTYSDYETYAYYMQYYGQPYLDVFAGEEKMTGAVLYVTSDELPVMYTLTGHGETGVSDSVLASLALENIQTESLNLLTAEAVPADCAVLALFGPVSDLTDRELELIEDYAQKGGRLLITTAYTPEPLPNFTELLADFGLRLVGGYVMESDSRYYSYGLIDLVLPSMGSHAVTAPLLAGQGGYTILMPDSQALLDVSDERTGAAVTALLYSSGTSYVKQNVDGLTSYEQTDGDEAGSFLLAAAAEAEDTGARLVVFGSTRFMEPEFSDMVSGANLDLFLNGADWLAEQEQSISIHPKTLSSDYLAFTDSAANVLKIALTIAVPVLFLAAGVGIFVKRRRR